MATIEVIHPEGTVVLRSFLSENEQIELYGQVATLYRDQGPQKLHGSIEDMLARKVHAGRYLLAFEATPATIPAPFHHVAQRAMTTAQTTCAAIPRGCFATDRLNAVLCANLCQLITNSPF